MYNAIIANRINKLGRKWIMLTVTLIMFIAPGVLNAQKVGHVNFQEIILLMPEYTMAATEYDLYQAALEDDLKAVENMIMEVQKNYEMESQKPAPNKTKMKIYMQQNESFQQEYQMLQQSSQDSLKAKMTELVAPIKKKVEEAVSAIAVEKGYSHIIDNSYGALIYANPSDNIDEAVKTKLNIKEKPAANSGAGKPTVPGTPR